MHTYFYTARLWINRVHQIIGLGNPQFRKLPEKKDESSKSNIPGADAKPF